MRLCTLFLVILLMLAGCVSARVSPGSTLWVVINNYHEEMTTLESRPELWPDRQRLAESMKMTYLATFGGSKEFNRLVDLDLRRREFLITLRQANLRPERVNEIQQELAAMNQQIDTLRAVIKTQIMRSLLSAQETSHPIESVATLGLLNLAIDEFSTDGRNGNISAPVTNVGPYTVTGQGLFSEVRTPEGRMFRCATTLLGEQGASINCEPLTPR
jgi:hypothetical protein